MIRNYSDKEMILIDMVYMISQGSTSEGEEIPLDWNKLVALAEQGRNLNEKDPYPEFEPEPEPKLVAA